MKKQIALLTAVGLVAICLSAYSQAPIPGGVTNAGMTYIVPDTPVWYNTNQLPGRPFAGYMTNGPIVPQTDQLSTKTALPSGSGNYGNWDSYTSVIGDHTFMVGCGLFADDGSWYGSTNLVGSQANQRYVLTLQPAAGGPPKHAEFFYDDYGNPYPYHQIMRQRTPGTRVGGDKRYGAKNFMTGGTTSLHYVQHWFPSYNFFTSDGRINTAGPLYGSGTFSQCNNDCADNPSGTWDDYFAFVQPFSLDPATLAQTPLAKAFDPIYYPAMTNSTPPAYKREVSLFGGSMGALSDGNFVVSANDFTGFFGGNVANDNSVATIVKPDGTTVVNTWYMPGAAGQPNGSWGEFAAFRGGFAIKVYQYLYFYKNDGTPIATIVNWYNNPGGDGISWQGWDRGDDMRIVSDPRSDYVYIAGRVLDSVLTSKMALGVWDGQTGAFVTNCIVNNDLDLAQVNLNGTRASTAVDALNRVCVAYDGRPDGTFSQNQVMARVMNFDGTNITFLTPTFFPFINADNTNNIQANGMKGFISVKPNVSMTTRAICIAATCYINSTNDPAAGPNAGKETTVYTVISHPAPVDPPRPEMTITKSGSDVIIAWDADAGLFTLQSRSDLVSGSWADVSPQPAMVPATGNKYTKTVAIGSGPLFFRLMR